MTKKEIATEIERLRAMIERLRERAATAPRSAERRILNQIVHHRVRIEGLEEELRSAKE